MEQSKYVWPRRQHVHREDPRDHHPDQLGGATGRSKRQRGDDIASLPPRKQLIVRSTSIGSSPLPSSPRTVPATSRPPSKRPFLNRGRRRSSVSFTSDSTNIIDCLSRRELNPASPNTTSDLLRCVERSTARAVHTRTRSVALPSEAKCTIAVAMSPLDDDLVVSTHGGDHTVKISSFFTGKVLRSMGRHPRTPWAVAIHPRDSSLIASGCLAGRVCLWKNGQLYRELDLGEEIIMSLTFRLACRATGNKDLLYIAWGTTVWSWDFAEEFNAPQKVLERKGRVQCICFAADGAMLSAELPGSLQNLSRIYLWRDRSSLLNSSDDDDDDDDGDGEEMVAATTRTSPVGTPPMAWTVGASASPSSVSAAAANSRTLPGVLVLNSVVLYSDGGMSVSKCGRFMCAIQSSLQGMAFSPSNPTRCRLVVVSLQRRSLGEIVRSVSLEGIASAGLTSVKFSPTDEHIVCGYGVAGRPYLPAGTSSSSAVKLCLAVYSNSPQNGADLKLEAVKTSTSDDVNVAIFHPTPGFGVLYGTRQGPLRFWEPIRGESEDRVV